MFVKPSCLKCDMDVDAKTLSPGRSQTDQDTLPCVVESVSQAQKQQSDKLTQYDNVLQRLKVHLQEELEKMNSTKSELKECEKRLFHQQEGIAEHTARCKHLKEEIFSLLEEEFHLNTDVRNLEQRLKTDQRIHKEYTDKMADCRREALELEKNSSVQVALVEEAELLKQLQAEREELLSFISSEDTIRRSLSPSTISDESNSIPTARDPAVVIAGEIENLKATKQKVQRQIKETESLIQEEHYQQNCLLQDISVLKKRNQAQLLRLRNQVKEAQMRNHQWHEDACQMERQIAQLQQLVSDQEG